MRGLLWSNRLAITVQLAATNKLFIYLLAGITLAVTDTIGQRSIFQTCQDSGFLYPLGGHKRLAIELQKLIDSREALKRRKEAALFAARNRWNWEIESKQLVTLICSTLKKAMTSADEVYIKKLLKNGVIQSPCLELGSVVTEMSLRRQITEAGIEWFGTDIISGENVDYVADFESVSSVCRNFQKQRFRSVLVLNVLEHVFEPIKLLDNVFGILEVGGNCVISTPAVWPLHQYPLDYWRINPDFYKEYCRKRGLELLSDYFEYIGLAAVSHYKNNLEHYELPPPQESKSARTWSRFIHRLFNTNGRGIHFPSHVAVGAVIRKRHLSKEPFSVFKKGMRLG